jgi:hypothetical protein
MFYLTIAFSSCFMYLFAYTLYLYPYHDLMVQVISGRWCARVLATSLKMCLSRRTLVLGQQRMSFVMLLAGLPHHLRRP